jgi:hypothetical protein
VDVSEPATRDERIWAAFDAQMDDGRCFYAFDRDQVEGIIAEISKRINEGRSAGLTAIVDEDEYGVPFVRLWNDPDLEGWKLAWLPKET